MHKGILITKENTKALETQYGAEDDEYEAYIGFWLIAPFGDGKAPLGFLSKTAMDLNYESTGEKLKNDYVELRRRY